MDEPGKGSGAAKTGSTSGPSNNSSSSPSTYGETSPPNEELGTPAEFLKPRPPPPQSSKPIVSQYFQFASGVPPTAASAAPTALASPLRTAVAAAEALNSRLGGKTVGELKRELAYNRISAKVSSAAVAAAAAQAAQVAAAQAAAQAAAAAAAAANTSSAPSVSAPRVRRKYATAARHFERQLATKEEAKSGTEPRRCKKSHDARLRRLRRRNSCANTVDDGGGRASCVRNVESSNSDSKSSAQEQLPDAVAIAVQPSSTSIAANTCVATASPVSILQPPAPRLSETIRASANVLRTNDGVSLVFRDRVCPATLASTLRRHPTVQLSLSFFVPGDALVSLQSRLQQAFTPSSLDASAASPRPVVRWVERAETKTVSVSFEVEEVVPTAAAAAEPGASPTVPWRPRDAAATDSCVPSPPPNDPSGISAAAPSDSSHEGHLLRQTESQVFRGHEQTCSEQRSYPTSSLTSCPQLPHSGQPSS